MFQPQDFTTSQLIVSFIASTFFAFTTAYYAEKKGRSALGWFILGFILTIFALIVLYFLPPWKNEDVDKNSIIIPPSTSPDPKFPNQLDPLLPLPFELNKEENTLWFYLDQNHQEIGPVSLIALRELWNRGLLELNSYVWAEGMEKWEKVDQLPDLKSALNKPSIL